MQAQQQENNQELNQKQPQVWKFSDFQEINRNFDLDYLFNSEFNGTFYEYPFSVKTIERIDKEAIHLNSALRLKKNILLSSFEKSEFLSNKDLNKLALDFLYFGNCYAEVIKNKLNEVLEIQHLPAKFMRKDKKGNFFYTANPRKLIKYKSDKIIHLIEPDFNQEIYGKPEWLAVATSAFLNQSASKFRLRYYDNGSHAGYILYITDAANDEQDIENLQNALKSSKGPGNFKNMMIYAPNGKKDGLQVLPISEVTAKDEFFNIKKVSRDDQLASTRTPPNLVGVVPENTGGFGSVYDAASVFNRNEILPLQEVFKQINEILNTNIINFKPYQIEKGEVAQG